MILEDFTGEDSEIDIPGQYAKFGKPLPRYHAKFFKFNTSVESVITNSQVHLKIKMVGTSGKIYPFIVKCGTDIRRDQRMQQLFEIVNNILQSNFDCQKRNLLLRSYSVISLSKHLGLIECVEKAKSLSELIKLSLPDQSILKTTSEQYQEWIKASSSEKIEESYDCIHKRALNFYDAREVASKMKELADLCGRDHLPKALAKITNSYDEFLQVNCIL